MVTPFQTATNTATLTPRLPLAQVASMFSEGVTDAPVRHLAPVAMPTTLGQRVSAGLQAVADALLPSFAPSLPPRPMHLGRQHG